MCPPPTHTHFLAPSYATDIVCIYIKYVCNVLLFSGEDAGSEWGVSSTHSERDRGKGFVNMGGGGHERNVVTSELLSINISHSMVCIILVVG